MQTQTWRWPGLSVRNSLVQHNVLQDLGGQTFQDSSKLTEDWLPGLYQDHYFIVIESIGPTSKKACEFKSRTYPQMHPLERLVVPGFIQTSEQIY